MRRSPPPKDEVVMRAWSRTGGPPPTSIEPVGTRRSKKSVCFRLVGVGDGGSSVVAKLCRGEHARTEQRVYEDVLSRLRIPLPRYYGSVEEPEGIWLFLEDGGETRCDPTDPAHRILAARWLAALHGAARHIHPTGLPDRGPAHHLGRLRTGRRRIRENLGNPAFDAGDREALVSLVVRCDELEARWSEIEAACALLPSTLVHGDFCPKNLHVRPAPGGGLRFFAMDWEMAGWGTPASDLWPSRREPKVPIPDLDVYAAAVREHWPDLDGSQLQRIVALGRVFRNLEAIEWASADLPHRWPEKPISTLRLYREEIAAALEDTAWAA